MLFRSGNAAGGASKASGLLGGAAKIAGGLAVEAELAGLLADQAKDKEGIIGTLERGMADIFSGAALHRWGTEGMARQESAWSLGGAIDATAIGLGAAMQWVSGVGDRDMLRSDDGSWGGYGLRRTGESTYNNSVTNIFSGPMFDAFADPDFQSAIATGMLTN